jgi:transposase
MAPPPSHSQAVLPGPALVLDSIERVDGRFLQNVHVQPLPRCPACGKLSRSRHSTYLRRLRDLPWQGCEVELRLKAQRFRCRNRACTRKIFAAPIPEVARSHARWTTRVSEIIRLIGYTAGGLPGSRILDRLAIPISDDTVLRIVKASDKGSAGHPVRNLGVDDWAWRKGQSYGTILVDLDRHRVVALLPDRSSEAVTAWLQTHPGVEIVSRDRCGIYAEAAQLGAAEALQVADRFHLIMNLSAAVERALEERITELHLPWEPTSADCVKVPCPTERRPTVAEQQKQQRRDRRCQRYQRVVELHQLGYTQRAISTELGIQRKTVRRWLRAGQFPERKSAAGRKSHVRDFHEYLQRRWNEGCHNATRLFQEIRAQGYRGCRQMVSHHVSSWRHKSSPPSSGKKKADRIAPKHAAILACKPPERLSEQQRILFERVAANCPSVPSLHVLALDFRETIASKDRNGMLHWIHAAAHSGIGPMIRFAWWLKERLQSSPRSRRNSLEQRPDRWTDQPAKGHQAPNVWTRRIPATPRTGAAISSDGSVSCTESAEDPFLHRRCHC